MNLWKFSKVSMFSKMLYDKKRKPENAGNQQKAFWIRKCTLLKDLVLKSNQLGT